MAPLKIFHLDVALMTSPHRPESKTIGSDDVRSEGDDARLRQAAWVSQFGGMVGWVWRSLIFGSAPRGIATGRHVPPATGSTISAPCSSPIHRIAVPSLSRPSNLYLPLTGAATTALGVRSEGAWVTAWYYAGNFSYLSWFTVRGFALVSRMVPDPPIRNVPTTHHCQVPT